MIRFNGRVNVCAVCYVREQRKENYIESKIEQRARG